MQICSKSSCFNINECKDKGLSSLEWKALMVVNAEAHMPVPLCQPVTNKPPNTDTEEPVDDPFASISPNGNEYADVSCIPSRKANACPMLSLCPLSIYSQIVPSSGPPQSVHARLNWCLFLPFALILLLSPTMMKSFTIGCRSAMTLYSVLQYAIDPGTSDDLIRHTG